MANDRRKAMKSLSKKGFRKVENSHHIYFHHEHKGKETGAYTYFSHSKKEKELGKSLLLLIRKQLKLDKNSEAIDLLNCPMDGAQYNEILINKNIFDATDF